MEREQKGTQMAAPFVRCINYANKRTIGSIMTKQVVIAGKRAKLTEG